MKIKLSQPQIIFNANSGPESGEADKSFAGRWHFINYTAPCEFEYQVGIGNLSNSLAKLRAFSDFKLPEEYQPKPNEPDKLLNRYDTNGVKFQYAEVMNCFVPDEVDTLSAAILQGDVDTFVEALSASMLQGNEEVARNKSILVKDKSYLLLNNYLACNELIDVPANYYDNDQYYLSSDLHAHNLLRDIVPNFDPSRRQFPERSPNGNVEYKYLAIKHKIIGKELINLDTRQEFALTPFLLALLSDQINLACALLPVTGDVQLQGKVNSLEFFDILWIIEPSFIFEYLTTDTTAVMNALFKVLPKIVDDYKYKQFLNNPCSLNTNQVASLLHNEDLWNKLNAFNQANADGFFDWVFTRNKNINWNQTINAKGETLIFLLLRAKAFSLCTKLIKGSCTIDLTLSNNESKMCYEFITEEELLANSQLLECLLQNQHFRANWQPIQDGSPILARVSQYHANFLLKYNPNLLLACDESGVLVLADAKYDDLVLQSAFSIKDRHPKTTIEIILRKSLFGSFCAELIAKAKNSDYSHTPKYLQDLPQQYIVRNNLQDLVKEIDPEIFASLFPPPAPAPTPVTNNFLAFFQNIHSNLSGNHNTSISVNTTEKSIVVNKLNNM